MRPRLALVVVPLILAACSGGDGSGTAPGDTGGTVLIPIPIEVRSIVPPIVSSTQEKEIADQIFDVLADIGPGLNTYGDAGFTPRLASAWTWAPDSMSVAFQVNPAARWHDGTPVVAADVRFSLDLYKDPATTSGLAAQLAIVDSISTPDSLTAVAWFARKSPERFYSLVYNLAVLPQHLLRDVDRAHLDVSDFAKHPIGSGPFRFVAWRPRQSFEVAADTQYFLGRPRLDRVIWTLAGDPAGGLMQVVAGEADIYEGVTPDGMTRLATSEAARAVEFPGLTYGYLGFNLARRGSPEQPHPLFADKALRRALAMALDRDAMRVNVYDSLAVTATGPFTRAIPTADPSIPQVPFDSAGADRLLDSLGWNQRNAAGIRVRDGRPLRFELLIPTSSTPRRQYAELLQALLQPHGVQVDIDGVERGYAPRLFAADFDAIVMSWQIDPSPAAIRNTWQSTPPDKRGYNFQSYRDPAFDALLDSAIAEPDSVRARALFRRAYRVLTADDVAIWLFETRTFVGVHKRIRVAGPMTDTWWRFLRLWWIPANERIERDLAK